MADQASHRLTIVYIDRFFPDFARSKTYVPFFIATSLLKPINPSLESDISPDNVPTIPGIFPQTSAFFKVRAREVVHIVGVLRTEFEKFKSVERRSPTSSERHPDGC
jgi:hypothetical protein